MIIYRIETVNTMGGKCWKMWYFAWEDGKFVFEPNYMPEKYAIAIVPVPGFLVSVAAIASVINDSLRPRGGTSENTRDVVAQEHIV